MEERTKTLSDDDILTLRDGRATGLEREQDQDPEDADADDVDPGDADADPVDPS